jgi:hypothetical protein
MSAAQPRPHPGTPRPGTQPGTRPGPRWFFLITPKWLAWHLFTAAAVFGMLWLGDWQFQRAESGNALSWAYTFEWPIFAVLGAAFWAKTIIDELKPKAAGQPAPAELDLPPGAGQPAASGLPAGGALPGDGQARGDLDAADDAELAAYNAYLAKLDEQVRGHGRWHGLR